MRLDWQLVRVLLAHVEAETIAEFVNDAEALNQWQEGQLLSERLKARQNSGAVVVYKHLDLLIKAGLLTGLTVKMSLDGFYSVSLGADPSLTLEGYSLLESLRTDGFLDELKKFAKNHGAPLTVETVKILSQCVLNGLLK